MFSSLLRQVAADQMGTLVLVVILLCIMWLSFRRATRIFGDEDYAAWTWFLSLAVPLVSGITAGLLGIMFLITLLPR